MKGGDKRREVRGWGEVTKEGVTKREREAECVTLEVNKIRQGKRDGAIDKVINKEIGLGGILCREIG